MVSLVASSDVMVVGALVLRFFDATTFSYFATPLFAFPSVIADVLLLAILADRLRDMVYSLWARLLGEA